MIIFMDMMDFGLSYSLRKIKIVKIWTKELF